MAALSIGVEPLDQDCAAFVDRIPVMDNRAVSISTPALGDDVARALGKMGVLLLKNHGSIVAGKDVANVCVTAKRLERLRKRCCVRLPLRNCR
jgi:ribulose-5-phosphate 4-epimerase/fuculose-1-phosphate aldolase